MIVLLGLAGTVVLAMVATVLLLGWGLPTAHEIAAVSGERTIRLSFGDVRYSEDGDGDHAVVFLHGFNGQLAQWDAVWERRPQCGRWVRLDIPGYGRSRVVGEDFTLTTQVVRIREFLHAQGIRRVTLVGGSMGGSIAAQFAATYPDLVHRVLLLAPSAFPGSLRYSGVFGAVLDRPILNRMAWVVVRTKIFRMLFPDSKGLQALSVTSSYGEPWARALNNIHAPTIILWSKGDIGVSYTTARGVRDSIPSSELIWLEEATGHAVAANRPELVGEMACRLFTGDAPPLDGAPWLSEFLRQGENIDREHAQSEATS